MVVSPSRARLRVCSSVKFAHSLQGEAHEHKRHAHAITRLLRVCVFVCVHEVLTQGEKRKQHQKERK